MTATKFARAFLDLLYAHGKIETPQELTQYVYCVISRLTEEKKYVVLADIFNHAEVTKIA